MNTTNAHSMPKTTRTYSQHTLEAVGLLGRLIRRHRIQRGMTAQDLADRAGITRVTLRRIERGNMHCEIGLAFEVAALVGVPLFAEDQGTLRALRERTEDKIALLPQTVRRTGEEVDDDF